MKNILAKLFGGDGGSKAESERGRDGEERFGRGGGGERDQ